MLTIAVPKLSPHAIPSAPVSERFTVGKSVGGICVSVAVGSVVRVWVGVGVKVGVLVGNGDDVSVGAVVLVSDAGGILGSEGIIIVAAAARAEAVLWGIIGDVD